MAYIGRTELYTVVLFCASVEEKTWFIWLYICTDSRFHTRLASKKELICMYCACAYQSWGWHLETQRRLRRHWGIKREASWGKQPMENQAPQCQCLTWNKCSAFFPQGWITSSWCDGPVSTSTERLYTPRKAQNDTVFIAARDKSLLFS